MAATDKDLEGIDLCGLIERFASEDRCHAYLEAVRWPDGVRCPRCDSNKISRLKERRQFDCDGCRYQFSVRVGTIFHDSKLPLWKWFLASYLMIESRKGVSANQLKRVLGVSYKTAWYLCHRIRATMDGGENEAPLTGIIEADDTWVGGRRHHRGGRRGDLVDGRKDWRDRKTNIIGAVERDGQVRLKMTGKKRTNRATAYEFLREHVADDAEAIYTDQFATGLGTAATRHETVNHEDEWVRGDVHTQTIEGVWSLFKRSIIGSYHHMSVKHLPAYLDEMEWRYNNRENPWLFRDTILKLVQGDTLPYKELIASS